MSTRGFDFTPIDPKQIPTNGQLNGRPSRYRATIGEFIRSGAQAVELDTEHNTRPKNVVHYLQTVIRRNGLSSHVCAFHREGRVFLARVTS